MALDREDIQKLGDLFTKGFEKLVKPYLTSGAAQARSSSRARTAESEPERRAKRAAQNLGKAQEELRKATDALTRLTKKEIETTKEGQEAQEKYNKALREVSEIMSETSDRFEELANKSLDKQFIAFKQLAKNTQGLSSKLAAAQSSSSQFASALLKSYERIDTDSTEYVRYIRDISKSISALDEKYLRHAELIDEATGAIKDNLNPNDIAKFRVQLGQTQTIINENLASIGVENIAKLTENRDELEKRLSAAGSEGIKSGEQFRDALIVIAEQLEKQGHKLGIDLKDRDKINYRDLAISISNVNTATNKAVKGLDVAAFKANTIVGKQFYGLSTAAGKIAKNLLDSATIIANFNKAKEAVKGAYGEMVDFNVAQIPASFMEIQEQSVRLGMSFKDTVKYLDENKRALGIYGQDAFIAVTKQFRETFKRFGYNMQQASEIVGPAFESAIASGVNIRDSNAMNEYMNKTMDSFKNISGIVSITAKEYARLNAELISSKDSQAMILGMDKERGAAYADQLVALRDNYVQLGLSTQAAQELVKQQQAQKREKVTTKIRDAAKTMVLAQQAGMSPEEAQEMFQLQIQGRARGAEGDKRLQELMTQLGQRSEEFQQQAAEAGIGGGMIAQTLAERLATEGAGATSMIDTGKELAMKQRARAAATPAEARAAGELAQGKESVAGFSQAINTAKSLLENNFVSAIGASALALVGLAGQAVLAAGALRLIQGIPGLPGGIAGGAPGGGGALGKIGRAAATGGRFLMGAGGVAAAGTAGYAVGEYIANPILNKGAELVTGTKGETVGGALYTGVDKFMGLFGRSDADKMKEAEQQAKIDLGKRLLSQGKPVSQDMANTLAAAGISVPPALIAAPGRPAATATPVVAGAATTVADVNKPAGADAASSSGILKVADSVSQDKLSTVIEKMTEAVALLKLISEQPGMTLGSASTPAAARTPAVAGRSIPTAMEALTGRS